MCVCVYIVGCACVHGFCILVRRKIKEKSVHTSALEAQVTDVCTGHQTGFIVGINCVRTRQEISIIIIITTIQLNKGLRTLLN